MTEQLIPGGNFEERALALLKAEVAERGVHEEASATVTPAWRRRGPRLVLAGTAVAAIAAGALIARAGSGDTAAAFAVEPGPEGTLSVEIRSPEDPEGLERALAQAGIPAAVTYLRSGTACEEPRFKAAPWPEGAHAIVVGSSRGAIPRDFPIAIVGPPPGPTREFDTTIVAGPRGPQAAIQEPADGNGPVTFWISRTAVGPGQTLVVTVAAGAEGVFSADTPIQLELAEGSVAPCEPVPAAGLP